MGSVSDQLIMTFNKMNIIKASIIVLIGICSNVESRTSNCGKADVGDRIVGGDPADPNSIPWQVGVGEFKGKNNSRLSLFCGGTILTPYHILTAAHCISPTCVKKLGVIVGEHNTRTWEGNEVLHEVDCAQNHPQYDDDSIDNDFSILTLKKPIDLSSTSSARAACLPDASDDSFTYNPDDLNESTKFVISGWGNLVSDGKSPRKLHHVSVPFVSQAACARSYDLTSNMLCAGNVEKGGVDSCQGDSGGPMTWLDPKTGTAKVVGVVSFGAGCGDAGYPGVYAKVTAQLDWINQQGVKIEQNVCNAVPEPTTTPGTCNLNTVNDGTCDDANNNLACFYDGMDCCNRRRVKRGKRTGRCKECKCNIPPESKCEDASWIGDKYCDDETNNPECNYDGGDCCKKFDIKGSDCWDSFCTDCQCKALKTD